MSINYKFYYQYIHSLFENLQIFTSICIIGTMWSNLFGVADNLSEFTFTSHTASTKGRIRFDNLKYWAKISCSYPLSYHVELICLGKPS